MPGMRRHSSPPVRRGFAFREFKALDEARGLFEGYLAVIGNSDLDDDIIDPGAMDKTLAELKAKQASRRGTPGARYLLPVCWHHDLKQPVGGVLEAFIDSKGLYVKGEFDLDTEMGARAYSGTSKGYISGLSIGFWPIRYVYDREGRRHLKEIAIFECTVCPVQANPEAIIMQVKSASDEDKQAQEARSKKYGIAIKAGGNVTKPSEWANLSDADFGDPVNYRYPMPDKEHADNAAARFKTPDARSEYSEREQDIIAKRIMKKQRSYGEEPDWWPPDGGKSITMQQRQQQQPQSRPQPPQPRRAKGQKAADFTTALTALQQEESLQEEWHDTFQAFVMSAHELMVRAVYGMPLTTADEQAGSESDPLAQAQANADAFAAAFVDLVQRSLAAEFVPLYDDDCDSFADPDADEDEDEDAMGYMSADLANAETKAGRVISQANAAAMRKALDDMADAHKAASKALRMATAGHQAAYDLLKSMQPGASDDDSDTTDDEDASGNESETMSAGKNGKNGKSLRTHAPGAPSGDESDTTQQQQQQQQLTAEDISRILREKAQALLAGKQTA